MLAIGSTARLENILWQISSLNDLLFNLTYVLNLAQADLLVADGHTNYQNSNRRHYLNHSHGLAKDENVAEHGVDDVDEVDEGDEACAAALESDDLAHTAEGVEASRAKHQQVVERAETQKVKRPRCDEQSQSQIDRRGNDAEEAVVKEDDCVGNVPERAIEDSNARAHDTSYQDQEDARDLGESFLVTRLLLELIVINVPSHTRQQFILVVIFAHRNDNDGYEAQNHAQNFHSIDRLSIVVVAENARPKWARLEEDYQEGKRN